jgi:DNA-binding CsgD family transcriptional regulator
MAEWWRYDEPVRRPGPVAANPRDRGAGGTTRAPTPTSAPGARAPALVDRLAAAVERARATCDPRSLEARLARLLAECAAEGRDAHRLLGAHLVAGTRGAPDTVVVVVERIAADPPVASDGLPGAEALVRGAGLSPREAEVALLMAHGRSNPEIASALGVTVHTAKRHAERVLAKLGVERRRDVVDALRRAAAR